jgi:lipooligosaccharide transport system ATP-binding protein
VSQLAAIIEARGLQKSFGTFTAVDRIDFSVQEGEVFGFLGPNGAGKTTTMKMIQGISPRSAGVLTVLGMDVAQYPREIKKQMGVVPQETNLDPDFTAYENLLMYSRYFGIARTIAEQRIEELLDFVQLQEKRDVLIDKLSGGMKRRLILARALINHPRLLILDEPTIGLDPQGRHLIWDKLKSLQAAGNTIVLTTHYMEEAAWLCDRLVIMDAGKILVEGAPERLVKDQVGGDIIETESTPDVIACLDQHKTRYEIMGDTVQIVTDDPRELTRTLLASCNPRKVITRQATLEDVFLKLSGRALKE